MNTTDWINIFGYAASLCMVMGYLPQAIHTIRTRETDAIALPTFLLLGLGSIFFIVNGVLTNNIPLVITNAITTLASAIIFVIKVRNDLKKRNKTRK
ncbi:MAG: hypothetical protein K2G64_01000 [Muribaculaceae bacterium]|nr:hypothetical protein [Muribaculaceae bacterium]MDE5967657.1 hypothetical protein [Muribaculaceae bacterium]MDE7393705.1 hypothetical protein [Muribaculaceae bacterium]